MQSIVFLAETYYCGAHFAEDWENVLLLFTDNVDRDVKIDYLCVLSFFRFKLFFLDCQIRLI